MVTIKGIAHVELTVSNLDASESWYAKSFGFRKVWEGADEQEGIRARALFEPNSRLVLGLTEHSGAADTPFEAKRPGLDHLAFAVENREALKEWAARLSADGTACSGIGEVDHGASFTVRDPDGIAIEMYVQGPPTA